MKANFWSVLAIPAVALLLSGCGGLGKMVKKYKDVSYKVTPEILEAHGGKVGVKVDGTFPAKYFNKKATLTLTPVIKYEGGETPLKPITVEGEAVKGGGKVIAVSGGSFSYVDTAMYKDAMKNCELVANVKVAIGTKSADLEVRKLAIGTIITSTRVAKEEVPLLGGDKYEKETYFNQDAEVYFPIQQSTIMEKEKNSQSVKALREFAKKGYPTKSITITAYASPDGPIDLNDNLSKGRGDNSVKYVQGELKKLKIPGADNSALYNVQSKGEYWDGFTKLVSASSIEDRQLIINIVNSHTDVDKREQEIKNLAVVYTKLAQDILPKLRKSEISVTALEPKLTDAQMDSLAIADPDSLKPEELLYAATLTTDLEKKKKIYESFTSLHTSDWRGPNNVAFIQLKQKNPAGAKTNLDKAKGLIANNGTILNNEGVVATWESDFEGGKTFYQSAKDNGADVSRNMGFYYLRKGQYLSALQYMGAECSYNVALAQLLQKNYDEAGKKLNCADQNGATHYLKAVLGARTNNVDMVITNLKKAVELDASYRQEALNDLEFAKYKDSADFKNAVQ
ncbi:MAG: hypothetical protein HYY40_03095 [Bacteroidetes bacterium]|nr:hypothetical protein [Bacteroidota bacterium]